MNSNRGMKKWMPFAALPEQQTYMKQMLNDMEKVEKPELSEYQKEEINNVLVGLCQGNIITISYYDNGFIRKEKDEFFKKEKSRCILNLYCDRIEVTCPNETERTIIYFSNIIVCRVQYRGTLEIDTASRRYRFGRPKDGVWSAYYWVQTINSYKVANRIKK